MLKTLFSTLASLTFVVSVLMSGCAATGPLPDQGYYSSPTAAQAEIIIQGWEQEFSRLATEGCQFRGLQLACSW